MCGRYTLIKKDRILEVLQNFTLKVNLAAEIARWNIAPAQDILIATNRAQPTLEKARWGLVPPWAKDPSIGNKMINARSETLAEKPAFRKALAQRRCLIFADGFYEWRTEADGKTRTPMYIRLKNGDLFAFAGLWETWNSPDGPPLQTCTIITTAANSLVRPIHDRMPAILPQASYADWLAPQPREAAAMVALLHPYPAQEMEASPVSRLVNNPRSEGAALIQPAENPNNSANKSDSEKPPPSTIQGRLF